MADTHARRRHQKRSLATAVPPAPFSPKRSQPLRCSRGIRRFAGPANVWLAAMLREDNEGHPLRLARFAIRG